MRRHIPNAITCCNLLSGCVAAVYAFQVVDAHVDAHLKDFDVSDNLTVSLEPMFDYQYLPVHGSNPVYGLNLNISF